MELRFNIHKEQNQQLSVEQWIYSTTNVIFDHINNKDANYNWVKGVQPFYVWQLLVLFKNLGSQGH